MNSCFTIVEEWLGEDIGSETKLDTGEVEQCVSREEPRKKGFNNIFLTILLISYICD